MMYLSRSRDFPGLERVSLAGLDVKSCPQDESYFRIDRAKQYLNDCVLSFERIFVMES